MVLEKITSTDKWVEFWSKEDVEKGNWSQCSKWGYFNKAIDKAGIRDFIRNKGIKGLVITFYESGPNWEVESVRLPESAELTFEELYKIMDVADEPNREWEYPWPEMEFTSKVAEEYAKRYHQKILRHMKNVDLFL